MRAHRASVRSRAGPPRTWTVSVPDGVGLLARPARGVAAPGHRLVPAPKGGPGEAEAEAFGWLGQRQQQAADFRHGERDQAGSAPFLLGVGVAPGDFQIGMGQQREGDVAIPGRPLAHLVVVEAHRAFGVLEAGLDRPAHPGDADHRRHRRVCWPKDAVVGDLGRVAERAPRQQPVGRPWRALVGQLDAGPVVQPLALAPRRPPTAEPTPPAARPR